MTTWPSPNGTSITSTIAAAILSPSAKRTSATPGETPIKTMGFGIVSHHVGRRGCGRRAATHVEAATGDRHAIADPQALADADPQRRRLNLQSFGDRFDDLHLGRPAGQRAEFGRDRGLSRTNAGGRGPSTRTTAASARFPGEIADAGDTPTDLPAL